MDGNHSGHAGHAGHSIMDSVVNVTAKLTTLVSQAMTTAAPHHGGHEGHGMDHSGMDHSGMDHSGMDHSGMDHSGMDHSGMDHSGHGMNMNGSGMHGMQMFFVADTDVTILFKEWHVTTPGGMVGAVIGVILLALLYEGLKFLREQLYRQQFTRLSYTTCAVTSGSVQPSSPHGPAELHKITETRILSWPHLLQTCLHMAQVLLSYFLMLIFMTFNVWLCLGVLIGSGAGYFLFGWRKSTVVDISDHCH